MSFRFKECVIIAQANNAARLREIQPDFVNSSPNNSITLPYEGTNTWTANIGERILVRENDLETVHINGVTIFRVKVGAHVVIEEITTRSDGSKVKEWSIAETAQPIDVARVGPLKL